LAILQLAEKEKLNIDDLAKLHLSDFQYPGEITIRQLLSHSAGIPNPNPLGWIHLDTEHKSFDQNQFFTVIIQKNGKTKSRPNEKFSYSNLGYFLLGRIIEEVSGQTYMNYIKNNILKTIDITPEELGFEHFNNNQLAKGYQKRFSLMNALIGFFIDKPKFMGKSERKWKPFNKYYVNGAAYGGLIGKPSALVKYIQSLLTSKSPLLSDDYNKLLFTENITNSGKKTGMCLSWFKGKINGNEYFTHAGGGGGYYCEIRIYPELGMGSVIMFNRSGMTDERFLDKVDRFFV